MADGAVLSGLPRKMALNFAAHAVKVSKNPQSYHLYLLHSHPTQSAAKLVIDKGISPADVS